MKMSKEKYNIVLKVFKDNKELISKHKQYLIKNAKFKDLNVRLGFDIWRSRLIPLEVKDGIMAYDTDDALNDRHLQTALLKALDEIGLKEK